MLDLQRKPGPLFSVTLGLWVAGFGATAEAQQCLGRPDLSPCDDGDFCTQIDVCIDEVCVGQNPIVCFPISPCHDPGVCNPNIGVCSTPVKPDGSPCDPGTGDLCAATCEAGVCNAAVPVQCVALDQCHDPGVCNPTTGSCSDPAKPDGSMCDDGIAYTTGDSCQAGVCLGTVPLVPGLADFGRVMLVLGLVGIAVGAHSLRRRASAPPARAP